MRPWFSFATAVLLLASGQSVRAQGAPPQPEKPRNIQPEYFELVGQWQEAAERNDGAGAVAAAKALVALHDWVGSRLYLAEAYEIAQQKDQAFDALKQAIEMSRTVDDVVDALEHREHLSALRSDPRFDECLKRARERARLAPLEYEGAKGEATKPFEFRYPSPDDPYLTRLRSEFELDKVVASCKTDLERVQAVCTWVGQQWEHDGFAEPSKPDPITILHEARDGKSFRCVEYATVVLALLNALGIPTRQVALFSEDVETRLLGAGHVVAEAFLADRKQWVMVDAQTKLVPVLDGQPLSVLQFRQSLATNPQKWDYPDGLGGCMHYMRFVFDARWNASLQGMGVILVPKGSRPPTVFQRVFPVGKSEHTTDPATIYGS